MLAALNRLLFEISRHASAKSFTTCSYAVLDPAARRLSYACAGHPPPHHYQARTGQFSQFPLHGGFPLGVRATASYKEQQVRLGPGDVVVFDNIKPHLGAGVSASIGRAGASVLPLPPYSPDYTPIEEMYSKVKQGMRRAKARVQEDLYEALGAVLRSVTPADILGWFRHAGLCATHG